MTTEDNELNDKEQEIIDINSSEEEPAIIQYDITSYGADYTVDGLVKKLNRGDIFIPNFQREYVWSQIEASKLVESLLLGLPIPGIFLAKESESNKLLVIDGQQRLRSLQFYINGYFNPIEGKKTKRIFKLVKVQKEFEGRTFDQLEESDRLMVEDSIIHATIIKQESPSEDNTSVYHVFERLNSGGKKLTPQEIRAAVYHGALNDLITSLNQFSDWRDLFGPASPRLKDQELILRFLAVKYFSEHYSKPMNEFLNKFNLKNRLVNQQTLLSFENSFTNSISFLKECIGKKVFRPEGVFNVSVFESISVAVSKLIDSKGLIDCDTFTKNFDDLMQNEDYKYSISRATSDESVFAMRQEITWRYLSR
jgi:uncharacterized protein with ParB-like and HNH nuclease domain